MGAQKNRLNEMVLLSTQNKCNDKWIRNIQKLTLKYFVCLCLCNVHNVFLNDFSRLFRSFASSLELVFKKFCVG